MELIQGKLARIHGTIARIQVKEVVRLPEDPRIELDYDDLLKVEEAG